MVQEVQGVKPQALTTPEIRSRDRALQPKSKLAQLTPFGTGGAAEDFPRPLIGGGGGGSTCGWLSVMCQERGEKEEEAGEKVEHHGDAGNCDDEDAHEGDERRA